jgi:hypothetical protein
MSFYKKVEEALKNRQFGYLKNLQFYYGQDVKIYNMKKDEYERVYGRSSGALDENFFEICCIIVNNDVIPLGPESAGAFTTGALYTTHTDEVQIGQVVELNSGDGRQRRFAVTKKESYGVTTDVFHRYEIQSIGD